MSDFTSSSEIYKFYHASLNLGTISKETQEKMLRELFMSYDFKEVYTKINSLNKNPNADTQFLFLIKILSVYFMAYKQGTLPKSICNSIIKDMITNFEKYSLEKGFCDIFISYLMITQDYTNFLKFFENTNSAIFTNAPLDDLKMEVYYRQKDYSKCLKFILETISTNTEKCNYVFYERAINLSVLIFKDKIKTLYDDLEKALSQDSKTAMPFEKLSFENDKMSVANIFYYFNHIKENNLKTYFNAFKSGVLAQLNLLTLLMIETKKTSSSYIKICKALLTELLENISTKQSVLMEAKKFIVFLSQEDKVELFKHVQEKLSPNNNIESQIYLQKLESCLNINVLESSIIMDYLINVNKKSEELMKIYLEYTTKNVVKLEKGERLICDDIIILIMEIFFNFIYQVENLDNDFDNEEYLKIINTQELQNYVMLMLILVTVALENSPYNYDISIYLVRLSGILGLQQKCLEHLKDMNLKGPQFETVSYIAHPFFFNSQFKSGMKFLVSSLDKWSDDYSRSIRKTFWKMILNRNFANCEDIMNFEADNNLSYYKNILSNLDINLNINEKLHSSSESKHEEVADLVDFAEEKYKSFEDICSKKSILRNQDVLVITPKFLPVESFTTEMFDVLKITNTSYNSQEHHKVYRFTIDSMYKNNFLHLNDVTYKNNYFVQKYEDVYGVFASYDFLSLRFLCQIVLGKLLNLTNSNHAEFNDYVEKMKETYKKVYSKEDRVNIHNYSRNYYDLCEKLDLITVDLLEFYFLIGEKCENLGNKESENIFDRTFKKLKDFIEELAFLRKEFKSDLNIIKKCKYQNTLEIFSEIYHNFIIVILSKLLSKTEVYKKTNSQVSLFKKKLNDNFKSTLLNFWNESIQMFESNDEVDFFPLVNKALESSNLKELLNNYVGKTKDMYLRMQNDRKDFVRDSVISSKNKKNFLKEML